MTAFVKEWGDVYNKANLAISKEIGALRKTDKTAGDGLKNIIDEAQDATGAALAALAALDKINLDGTQDKKTLATNVKLAQGAIAKLQTGRANYAKTVDAGLTFKVTVSEQGFRVPKPLKDVAPESYRQLKILKTEFAAICGRAENQVHGLATASKIAEINAAKEKAKDKVKGVDDAANAKIKAISDEAAMKQFVVAFGPSFKSSMAKGAAAIQRMKAKPDVATYNKEMNSAGRDISQNLVNISKLQADPKFKSNSLAKKLPPPGALAADIAAFGNGPKRQAAATATAAQVQALVSEFSKLHKSIAATYADVLTGKLG